MRLRDQWQKRSIPQSTTYIKIFSWQNHNPQQTTQQPKNEALPPYPPKALPSSLWVWQKGGWHNDDNDNDDNNDNNDDNDEDNYDDDDDNNDDDNNDNNNNKSKNKKGKQQSTTREI